MNTDEQNTNDQAEAADNAQPSGNAPEKIAKSSDEEWDEQPGDDIGNRLPGASPRQAPRPPAAGAAAGGGGDAKKRKRNKKRKGPPGQTGEAAPQGDAETATDEASEASEAERPAKFSRSKDNRNHAFFAGQVRFDTSQHRAPSAGGRMRETNRTGHRGDNE